MERIALHTGGSKLILPGISSILPVQLPSPSHLKQDLPSSKYRAIKYKDQYYDKSHYDLPGIISEKMELSTWKILTLLNQISARANRGRIINIDEGHLKIVERGDEVHHIQFRQEWKVSWREAIATFPFSKELMFMLQKVSQKSHGREGHFLANLIPLTTLTHHGDIHKSGVTVIKTEVGEVSVDKLLVAFTIFNISDRRRELNRFLLKLKLEDKISLKNFNWIMEELNLIDACCNILIDSYSDLYELWKSYIGNDPNDKYKN